MMKFKGKYNLSVPYDLSTGEFPRDENGVFFDHDIRIDCAHGDYIYHYGQSILKAYINSAARCKHIAEELGYTPILYSDAGEFSFNVKDIERVCEVMKAKTSHATRSPFSVKNLPSTKEKNKANREYKIQNKELSDKLQELIKDKVKEKGGAVLEFTKIYDELLKKLKLKKEFKNSNLKPLYFLDQQNVLEQAIKILSRKEK